MQFNLPWPDKNLSPNARVHWSKLAKAKKIARQAAKYLCLNALGKSQYLDRSGKLLVSLAFYPKTKRTRDCDNLIAMHKAALDGIADALCVDDSRFILRAEICATENPPGVSVTIEAAP